MNTEGKSLREADAIAFDNHIAAIEQHTNAVRDLLWAAQLDAHPDSVIISHSDILRRWVYSTKEFPDNDIAVSMLHALIGGNGDPGIFYVCGKCEDRTYAHRGFRYGLEPWQYIAFPGNRV